MNGVVLLEEHCAGRYFLMADGPLSKSVRPTWCSGNQGTPCGTKDLLLNAQFRADDGQSRRGDGGVARVPQADAGQRHLIRAGLRCWWFNRRAGGQGQQHTRQREGNKASSRAPTEQQGQACAAQGGTDWQSGQARVEIQCDQQRRVAAGCERQRGIEGQRCRAIVGVECSLSQLRFACVHRTVSIGVQVQFHTRDVLLIVARTRSLERQGLEAAGGTCAHRDVHT